MERNPANRLAHAFGLPGTLQPQRCRSRRNAVTASDALLPLVREFDIPSFMRLGIRPLPCEDWPVNLAIIRGLRGLPINPLLTDRAPRQLPRLFGSLQPLLAASAYRNPVTPSTSTGAAW